MTARSNLERLNSPIAHPICTTTGSYKVSQPLLESWRSSLVGWRPGYQVGGQCYQVTRSARSTRNTRQPRLEVIASGWRPRYQVGGQRYQVTRSTRNTRRPRLEVIASGWRPGYQVGGQCYQVTRNTRNTRQPRLGANLVGGGQSSC